MLRQWQYLAGILAFSAAFLLIDAPAFSADKEKDEDYYELMKVFVDTFEQIERNYVKDVDRRQLMEAAIQGMISELDQYSNYINRDDLARFNQEVEQEFGGVGIQVQLDPETRRLTVMTPLPGTPAYKAGVRAGDVIMEIEGKDTSEFPKGKELDTAVKYLKGEPGKPVTIGVRHLGENKIEQITIVRDIIHVSTVLGDYYQEDDSWDYMIDDESKIAYIRLTHFSRHSAEELRKVLQNLESKGMQALILDMRFNPGGLLSQATEIADLFIESGKIVSTDGRNSPERVWNASKSGTFTDFPMVVLVNRFSASASEIVSACLQDHDRAVVIGERTWGKGSVQNVIELEEGSSALKLTTASYHRPSGKNIHKFPGAKDSDEWGVVPDQGFKVRMSADEIKQFLEYRRERDILKEGGPPESDFVDAQLKKALDYIREQLGEKSNSSQDKAEEDSQEDSQPDDGKKAPKTKTSSEEQSKTLDNRLLPRHAAA